MMWQRCVIPTGRADQGLVVHSLRHFFETQAVNSRIPQVVVDAWMGHAGGGSMGKQYYRLSDEMSQQLMKQVTFEPAQSAKE